MVAKLLLVVFLVSNTPLKLVTRIPVLIEHFAIHNGQEGSLSFISFIEEHYLTDKPHHHDAESGQHENLPFKSPSDFSNTGIFVISWAHEEMLLKTWNIWKKTTNCNWNTLFFIPLQVITAIFHPPKNVA
jgi:hypothetical protein